MTFPGDMRKEVEGIINGAVLPKMHLSNDVSFAFDSAPAIAGTRLGRLTLNAETEHSAIVLTAADGTVWVEGLTLAKGLKATIVVERIQADELTGAKT